MAFAVVWYYMAVTVIKNLLEDGVWDVTPLRYGAW